MLHCKSPGGNLQGTNCLKIQVQTRSEHHLCWKILISIFICLFLLLAEPLEGKSGDGSPYYKPPEATECAGSVTTLALHDTKNC